VGVAKKVCNSMYKNGSKFQRRFGVAVKVKIVHFSDTLVCPHGVTTHKNNIDSGFTDWLIDSWFSTVINYAICSRGLTNEVSQHKTNI
jgi:hypothetical protein